MSKLIIGCGYLGNRLADHWVASGHHVFATTRKQERLAELQNRGIEPIVLDVVREIPPLPRVDTIVYAVGFDRNANRSIQQVYVEGLRAVLAGLEADANPPKSQFIYVSSTGVYGETSGEWIDEMSPCLPEREGGKGCWQAEQLLTAHPVFAPLAIRLRLAGIYGPGRLPQLETLRRQQPLAADPNTYLNLVHVDDAVSVISACAEKRWGDELFCVSDGHPVLRADFYRELAQLLHVPLPRFAPPTADDPPHRRHHGDKRINSSKLRRMLEIPWYYPTYREGLRQIASVMSQKSECKFRPDLLN